VTPKGGPAKRAGSASGRAQVPTAGGRYTAPIPRQMRSSPAWVPVMIVAFFVVGVLVIMLNYLGLLGGSANNAYLFIGLGLIVAGFIASTRWH
jgi:Cell division protein CrgA